MLSGPSIANEFAREMPTVVVLAGEQRNDLLTVARVLDSDCFRTRFSDDAIGVELGGILKNIYTIGLGLFDGKKITFKDLSLPKIRNLEKFGILIGNKTFYPKDGLEFLENLKFGFSGTMLRATDVEEVEI